MNVNCSQTVKPEPCPVPVSLEIAGCQDAAYLDLGDLILQPSGCIVQLDVTIRRVCPEKRVALAVWLTEEDSDGKQTPRGLKTVTIPAFSAQRCRDVVVRCIKFILPGDSDGRDPCAPRKLKAAAFAHYIDTDFRCC